MSSQGWTSHYLGKISVLGFDLSEEMLELARERVDAQPFPPYPKARLDVRHDIEAAPLGADAGEPFAVLDSSSTTFAIPSRLCGVWRAPGCPLAIIEGFRAEGAPLDPHGLEIMRRYHTIERPTRSRRCRTSCGWRGSSITCTSTA